MYYNILIDNIENLPDNISEEEWELKVIKSVDNFIKKNQHRKRFLLDTNDVYMTDISSLTEDEKIQLYNDYDLLIDYYNKDFTGDYFVNLYKIDSESEDSCDEQENSIISNTTQGFSLTVLGFLIGSASALLIGNIFAIGKY